MRDRIITTWASFAILAILDCACSGCSETPPSPSQYDKNVRLVATRNEENLTIEVDLPPRTDGFTETCTVTVSMQGDGYGRILLSETNRTQETSNKRLITTELTDQERSVALDVEVGFAVWKSNGYHNSTELFRGRKVAHLPLPRDLPKAVDLRPEFEKHGLPLRSQGQRPTSTVFTVVEAVEFATAKAMGECSRLSVEFANWASNSPAADESARQIVDGKNFYNIIHGLTTYGICPEEMMPYAESFSGETKPTKEATQQASEFSKQTKLRFYWIRQWRPSFNSNNNDPGLSDEDIHVVRTVLAVGNPVCASSSQSVLLVGYEDDPALRGGGRFLIADSNLVEKDIDYETAKARFRDLLWVSVTSQQPEKSKETSNDVQQN